MSAAAPASASPSTFATVQEWASRTASVWTTRTITILSSLKDLAASGASKLYTLASPLFTKVSSMFGKDRDIALPAMAFGAATVAFVYLVSRFFFNPPVKP